LCFESIEGRKSKVTYKWKLVGKRKKIGIKTILLKKEDLIIKAKT